jgi:outer membrane receptor protein involved in Fe transport
VGVYNISDTTYRVHASGFNAPGARLIFGVKVRI